MDNNPVKNMMHSIAFSKESTYREAQIDSLIDQYNNGTKADRHEIFKEYHGLKHDKPLSQFESLWSDLSITDPDHPANLTEISTDLFNKGKNDIHESQRASVLMTALFHIPNELGENGWDRYMASPEFEEDKINILHLLMSRNEEFESDLDDPQVQELINNIWDRCTDEEKTTILTSNRLRSITPATTSLNVYFLKEVQTTKTLEQEDYNRFAYINDGFSGTLGHAKKTINQQAFKEERNASTMRYMNRVKKKINSDTGFRDAYNFITKSDKQKDQSIDLVELQENLQIFVNGLHEIHHGKPIKEAPTVIFDPKLENSGGYSRVNNTISLSPSVAEHGVTMFLVNHEFRHFVQHELAESSDSTKNDFRNVMGQIFKQDIDSYVKGTIFKFIPDQDTKNELMEKHYESQIVEEDANAYGLAIAVRLRKVLELESNRNLDQKKSNKPALA